MSPALDAPRSSRRCREDFVEEVVVGSVLFPLPSQGDRQTPLLAGRRRARLRVGCEVGGPPCVQIGDPLGVVSQPIGHRRELGLVLLKLRAGGVLGFAGAASELLVPGRDPPILCRLLPVPRRGRPPLRLLRVGSRVLAAPSQPSTRASTCRRRQCRDGQPANTRPRRQPRRNALARVLAALTADGISSNQDRRSDRMEPHDDCRTSFSGSGCGAPRQRPGMRGVEAVRSATGAPTGLVATS
jgi:hypothetical protein